MANSSNSFKKMEQEDQEQAGQAPKQVEHEIMGFVQSGHFFGDVVELYFSKMINLFLALFGADSDDKKES